MQHKHEIEKIAYELYERDGRQPGREIEHWIEAEKIFHSRQGTAASKTAAPVKAAPAIAIGKKTVLKEGKTASESKTSKKAPVKAKSAKSGSSRKEASL